MGQERRWRKEGRRRKEEKGSKGRRDDERRGRGKEG